MTTTVIEAHQLGLQLAGKCVLSDVSLHIERGHFLGIVGPNGAGKSTLIGVLTGRHPHYRGLLRLFGTDVSSRNRRRLLSRIGYLHQMHSSQSHLPVRVEDVVAMGLADWNRPLWHRVDRQAYIAKALRRVDMEDFRHADFRCLSGGQMQRVRLARALVREPELLLLDEPAAAMDNQHQQQLYRLLRHLCDTTGMSVVMVEHDIAAITGYVDSVACLNQRIHYHAMKGEQIPEDIWHQMYGSHMHVIAHDRSCIGCHKAA